MRLGLESGLQQLGTAIIRRDPNGEHSWVKDGAGAKKPLQFQLTLLGNLARNSATTLHITTHAPHHDPQVFFFFWKVASWLPVSTHLRYTSGSSYLGVATTLTQLTAQF